MTTKRFIITHTILVSLLLHLLLLSAFVLRWHMTLQPQDTPQLYIPSYAYHEAAQPSVQENKVVADKKESAKDGIEKFNKNNMRLSTAQSAAASATKPTFVTDKNAKNKEAINLIGKQKIVKPLIKILGHALADHLSYPKIAIDFNLRGESYVGFTLHPDGQVTDVKLMQSSGATVLDQAALNGIRQISPVKGVGEYITKPEFVIIGVIFG